MSHFKWSAMAAILAALLFAYSNCAKPNEISPLDVSSDTPNAISVSVPMSVIGMAQSMRIQTVGGKAPYSFTVISGSAVIDPDGNVHGPFTAGTVVVEARDADGKTGRVTFVVTNTAPIPIGALNGFSYMTTPGGCDNSATPACPGGQDSTLFIWGDSTIRTAVQSTTDGAGNTATLAVNFGATAAAKYCYFLVYGGYSDWFLPSTIELQFLYANRASVGGLDTGGHYVYWTSSEYTDGMVSSDAEMIYAHAISFANGSDPTPAKDLSHHVRCMRKDPI
jgi:hypothetical protein